MDEESVVINAHIPCDDCGSSDALCEYSDGHTHCYSCGKTRQGTGRVEGSKPMETKDFKPVRGEYRAIKPRKLSIETCQKYHYRIGEYGGEKAHIADYYKDGNLVGQKIRLKDKQFRWNGTKERPLYGMHIWKPGGKMLVVTEGEIDCLSVSQAQDNKWPVVSIPNGAQGAKKACETNLDYLESFDAVVFMFDNDEPGKKAASECCPLLTPGKARVAELPLKDANEMLMKGREAELRTCIWQATEYAPDGIINASTLWDEVQKPLERGLSYPFKALTDMMYGIRPGTINVLGAGTGLGKTTVFKEIAYHLAMEHDEKVGLIFLEESNTATSLSMMSLHANKPLHLLEDVTVEEKKKSFDEVLGGGKFYMFDHFGSMGFEKIRQRIRYLVVSCGIKYIFLDHLAALTTGDTSIDERREIDYIISTLASMVRELGFTLFLISHLNSGSGKKNAEEGARVTLRDFRGSRAIAQWSDAMFAIERDQQAESEEERHTSTFRILKDRHSGQATGKTFNLKFNTSTHRVEEVPEEFSQDNGGAPDWEEDDDFEGF